MSIIVREAKRKMKIETDEVYIIDCTEALEYFKRSCAIQGIKLSNDVYKMFNLFSDLIKNNHLYLICYNDTKMRVLIVNDATSIDGVWVKECMCAISDDLLKFLKSIGCDSHEIEYYENDKKLLKGYKNKDCVICMKI